MIAFFDFNPMPVFNREVCRRLVHAARLRYEAEHGKVFKLYVDMDNLLIIVNEIVSYKFQDLYENE